MFGVLLKKHFTEMFASMFVNRKTGKVKSKGGIIGYAILLGFCFIIIMGSVFSLAMMLALAFIGNELTADFIGEVINIPPNSEWLYFAILSILAILLGVFGSVFNTYASLYKAKDNDFLLSLPIKPMTILAVRMSGVFGTSLMYSALIWIPTIVAYFIVASFSWKILIYTTITYIMLVLFVTVLTCALGYVVAIVSSKLKNKSFITVIISVVFFALYYFVCFKASEIFTSFVANSEQVGKVISTWMFPIYHLSKGAAGNTVSLLIFSAFSIVLFALCCYILQHSFFKLVTATTGTKQKIYTAKEEKSATKSEALLGKEFGRFFSSPTYMLNTALGVVFILIFSVFVIIKAPDVSLLDEIFPGLSGIIPIVAVGAMIFMLAMNVIAMPSVSLEGKSIEILHSLPVDGREVLFAKEKLQAIINFVPSVVCLIALEIVFKQGILTIIASVIALATFVWFSSALSTYMGVKKPIMVWANESIPIKQNLAIFIPILGSIIVGGGAAFGACVLAVLIPTFIPLLLMAVLFALVALPFQIWINEKGGKEFDNL